jgi:hypothetical protein
VRFASTSRAGFAASSGPSTPAAAADHEQRSAAQRHAGTGLDITHQPSTVSVVAEPAVGVEAQRVHSAGECGACTRAPAETEGVELERHRDVAAARQATVLAGGEVLQRAGEPVERAEQAAVAQHFTGLARELGVDEGRLAVLDRVAGDDVAVHGASAAPSSAASFPAPRRG